MTTRLLAEWEKQSAVIIAWPYADGDFAENLAAVEETYQHIAETILQYQQLIIICKDVFHRRHIQSFLPGFDHFIFSAYNDIWVRDTAPLTVATPYNDYRLLNFQFNGWGEKYPHQEDNALNERLFDSPFFERIVAEHIPMVLEGGSVETDGMGTLLTTRHCLLNSNRNPTLTQNQIENKLRESLGIKRFLWLDQQNLIGDDTDAHIDTLARFCSPEHIVYCSCDDVEDSHYPGLKHMEMQLQSFNAIDGKPYRTTALPLPAPVYNPQGQRLPANYANFLIINDAVLVPTYDDPKDAIALDALRECFPQREMIGVPCLPLVQQYGSLHCMTMQFPENIMPKKFEAWNESDRFVGIS